MGIVVKGRLVPLAKDNPGASFQGSVWIDDDGRVEAITRANAHGPAGYETAPVVDVGESLVFPGLVDLHNHLAYNTLGLWNDPTRAAPYTDHTTWPRRPSYAPDVTWPAYAFITAAPDELLAYAEVKAIVGGATSIQGSPPKNRPRDGWLVRNIEDETWGVKGGANTVYASALTAKPTQLQDRANKMRTGSLFIYHCAEGQLNSAAASEYTSAERAGCLQERFVAVHCSSVAPSALGEWPAAQSGTIAWSPFSNYWLYGQTTPIGAALDDGLTVCLGSDWAPSGTKNILGELKVARIVSDTLKLGLDDETLVHMVTCNPGDVLARAWPRQVGRLEPGCVGDLVVILPGAHSNVFTSLVVAVERDVQLVVVDGTARYGTTKLMADAAAPFATPLTVGGSQRRVSLDHPTEPDQGWTWAEVIGRLEEVRADPKKEIEAAQQEAAAFDGPADAGDAPLRLALDMPTGIAPMGGLPKDLDTIEIPPLDSLTHDRAFFKSVHTGGFHGGLLDGLATFYD